MKTLKILVTNQKGGVGKSTIAANLAAYLAMQNNGMVNLLDFDRQASSFQWISRAPNIGLKVHRVELDYSETGGLVLAKAKRYLNYFSLDCAISISDLTWTYAIPSELMLEYDLILVPSATSKFEMAYTEIFILEYIQKHFQRIKNSDQQTLIIPSRVEAGFESQGSFGNIQSLDNCSVTPPIFYIPSINDFIYEDFLCVSNNAEVANNFSALGSHVSQIIQKMIANELLRSEGEGRIKNLSNHSVLDRFRLLRRSTKADESAVVSDPIPTFLLKK